MISSDDRKYDWASHEIFIFKVQEFKRSKKWNILPAFTVDGYIAWKMHHDNIIVAIFNDFVRNQVLLQCTSASFGGPRFVLMLNNAKIHWNSELIEMCETADVIFVRLFFYFFDFNPIEISFVLLKVWIRKHAELATSYEKCGGFEKFLENAVMKQKRMNDLENLFRLVGIEYFTRNWCKSEMKCKKKF